MKEFTLSLGKDQRYLLGLSGGADSVCLFHLLLDGGYSFSAAHINHGIRGSEADSDEEFCRELCRKHGIDIISLDCDGVTDRLLDTWVENGVNVMFPIEIGTWGDQFEAARNKYGEKILGVGGMDKTALRKDKAAVDAEIERLKRLVAMGGFIPCPDHRIMPGSKFELVQYYTEEIKKIRV